MNYDISTVKTFRQADSRWGGLTYPSKPYYMSGSGCGATACADVIASHPKHKNVTPKTIRNYMVKKGFAIRGAGTLWSGVSTCLKDYGFAVTVQNTMQDFFNEMAKGGRRAVILFRAGTRGGVTWTSEGHFLAISGYKEKNGKHYLKMHDPGGRHNDGWFAYETTMKGLIPWICSCYIKETDLSNAEKIARKAESLAHKQGTDKKIYEYGYNKSKAFTKWSQLGTSKPTKAFMNAYDKYYKKHWQEGMSYGGGVRVGAACNRFVGTVVRASGVYSKCSLNLNSMIKSLRESGKFVEIKYAGDKSKLKRGDIIVYKNITTGRGHTYIYIGNGYIAEAVLNSKFPYIHKLSDKKASITDRQFYVFRTKDNVKITVTKETKKTVKNKSGIQLPKRGYFTVGDKGAKVKTLQKWLNKHGYKCGSADGIYGGKTEKAVLKFQKHYKLTRDGLFGKACLKVADKIGK